MAFNEEHRDQEMPYFAQELFQRAEAKGSLTTLAYRKAREHCRKLSRTLGIDAVMSRHRLDALVAPTGSPPWPTDLVNGDHFTGSTRPLRQSPGTQHLRAGRVRLRASGRHLVYWTTWTSPR